MDHPREDVAPGQVAPEDMAGTRRLANRAVVRLDRIERDQERQEDRDRHDDGEGHQPDDREPVAQEPAHDPVAPRPSCCAGHDLARGRLNDGGQIGSSGRRPNRRSPRRCWLISTANVPTMRTTPIISAGSRSRAARTASWPSPGQLKTVSVITAPAINSGSRMARTVMTGIRALRRPWRIRTTRLGQALRPRGRHVVTAQHVEHARPAYSASAARHWQAPG